MTAIKLTGVFNENKSIVDKIKEYLEDEVNVNSKYTYDDYDHEVVDDLDVYLFRGRAEVASGLLEQINEWEKS
jgi:hypothetical protein|tara:strand:+ start:164 stop:382 length:219 start_codon:yes stop_codon:yes gene_type:complete